MAITCSRCVNKLERKEKRILELETNRDEQRAEVTRFRNCLDDAHDQNDWLLKRLDSVKDENEGLQRHIHKLENSLRIRA
jgi:peptidoglycan hydrolase CwlO-like protein